MEAVVVEVKAPMPTGIHQEEQAVEEMEETPMVVVELMEPQILEVAVVVAAGIT